jgi:hypothetical protein
MIMYANRIWLESDIERISKKLSKIPFYQKEALDFWFINNLNEILIDEFVDYNSSLFIQGACRDSLNDDAPYSNLEFMKAVFEIFENEYWINKDFDYVILEFFLDLYENNTEEQRKQILCLIKNKDIQEIILTTDGNPYKIVL